VLAESRQYPESQLIVMDNNLGDYDGGPLDYVHAAIVVLMRRAYVTLPSVALHLDSNIPVSAGLSSSAAVTLATLGALARYFGLGLSRTELCRLAYEVEATELKTGAGEMDFYICASGGITYLDCSHSPPRQVPIRQLPADVGIVIADSLVQHSTKQTITDIRARLKRGDPNVQQYFELTSLAVAEMSHLMQQDHRDIARLGELISTCHTYMKDLLGVSTEIIDRCVRTCLEQGAYGAKITGAGGGGSMFAIAPRARIPDIVDALGSHQVGVFVTAFDQIGMTYNEPSSGSTAAHAAGGCG
jgi:mevalonate kinase